MVVVGVLTGGGYALFGLAGGGVCAGCGSSLRIANMTKAISANNPKIFKIEKNGDFIILASSYFMPSILLSNKKS